MRGYWSGREMYREGNRGHDERDMVGGLVHIALNCLL